MRDPEKQFADLTEEELEKSLLDPDAVEPETPADLLLDGDYDAEDAPGLDDVRAAHDGEDDETFPAEEIRAGQE